MSKLSTTDFLQVKILADSLSPKGHRLTTFQLCYPRFVHAELLTHRMFSRNSSSSRAIPTARLLEQEIYVPAEFGTNQRGMQPGAALNEAVQKQAKALWLQAATDLTDTAESLAKLGVHKQWANRLLEPFTYISTVLTGTKAAFDGFFRLRAHPDAQFEIRELALAMQRAYASSEPVQRKVGEWHLPYVTPSPDDFNAHRSAARCARVSYLTHDGRETTEAEDLALYTRLVTHRHMSPLEHVAFCDQIVNTTNFAGTDWVQLRQIEEMRCQTFSIPL